MKNKIYFYSGKLKSLPAGLLLLVVLVLFVLIPLILSVLLIGGITYFLINKIATIFLPAPSAAKKDDAEYEIIDITEYQEKNLR